MNFTLQKLNAIGSKLLLSLDARLAAFAQQHDMSLSSNYHNWPERSLEWGSAPRRLIQIFMEGEALVFNVWLCASEDRGETRYWKNQFLMRAVPIDEIERDLHSVLETGREQLEKWHSEDLLPTAPID